jgi:hypothetical protein
MFKSFRFLSLIPALFLAACAAEIDPNSASDPPLNASFDAGGASVCSAASEAATEACTATYEGWSALVCPTGTTVNESCTALSDWLSASPITTWCCPPPHTVECIVNGIPAPQWLPCWGDAGELSGDTAGCYGDQSECVVGQACWGGNFVTPGAMGTCKVSN